jgi:HSP20 family protein
MALLRWEPIGELHSIQTEMNRLFNTVFDPSAQAAGGNPATRRWIPPMDLVETGDSYVLRADLPGLSEADVNIEFEDNVLTITGERRAEHDDGQAGFHRVERGFGAFSRSLSLPDGVSPESVQAHFDRGVLEIRILKPEQRKPRKVAISVTDSPAQSTIEARESHAGESHASAGANGREPASITA